MQSVAALAGVGIKTVSRVINGEPHVKPETEEKVRRAIAMLGYHAHEQASALRRTDRRTRTLGLLVGNVANPFSGAIHRAVEDYALGRGTAVFASSLDDDQTRERMLIEAFLRRRVDGLILTTIAASQSYLGVEVDRGTPIVFVDRQPNGLEADTIASDNVGGARTATAHLLDRGHRRIAYLGDDPAIQTARLRRSGFDTEMTRAGTLADDRIVRERLTSADSSEAAALELFARPQPPTAIFSAQNVITIGAVRALRQLGLQHEIAIVGFDDLPLADMLDPGLTVIQQDAAAIGHLAVERVFARLDGDLSPTKTTLIATTLVARGSGELAPRV